METPNSDYHWYRQNPDGTWSHCDGIDGDVKNTDNNGTVIYDPEHIVDDYNTIVGYYCVSEMPEDYEVNDQCDQQSNSDFESELTES